MTLTTSVYERPPRWPPRPSRARDTPRSPVAAQRTPARRSGRARTSYSPAGASLLGAPFSGTNSPSAPVRRRARGWKGPDPVSSPSVFLPGGCGNWRLHTARGTLCPVIQFSGARRGAPRGRPAQAALIRPPTQPPGHPGSPRRRFAGARGAQAGSQTPLPGVVRRPPSCPAAAGPQAHSPGRREWADRSGQRATLAPRVRRDAAWAPRPSCPAVPPATERGRGASEERLQDGCVGTR
ncbi:dapper homolog 3-like [Ailuropoda melanoleuca]|uniref:dapper homolog 3-like n=1 Tax=Ailuropoda melanoleuca TaxID=9646 RepID=UPI001494CF21|nr:dapper homolog 3-like [Ailuropoda melanoleuca]